MKKTGCIYKRGKIFWVKYYQRCKAIYESSKSDDRHVAEKLLLQREIEAEQDKLPNFKAERTKWDQLAEDYLRDYRIHRRKSISTAELRVKILKEFFGGMRAHDITANLVNKYIDQRKSKNNKGIPVANATINRELAALKKMFNLGLKHEKVLRKPYIEELEENNVREGFFEHDEFLALRTALPDHLKTLVTLAYYTGMRKGEILGIRWNQVNLSEGTIRLEQKNTKTKRPRTIYMNDEVWSMLVSQKRDRDLRFPDMPFVFYTPKGEPIESFRKAWATACKKVGIQGKLFHDFRRSGVRNLIRSGTPERVAMSISGHSTRTVFDRYNIVSEEDLKLATKRVEAYTKAKSEAESPYKELEGLEMESAKRYDR